MQSNVYDVGRTIWWWRHLEGGDCRLLEFETSVRSQPWRFRMQSATATAYPLRTMTRPINATRKDFIVSKKYNLFLQVLKLCSNQLRHVSFNSTTVVKVHSCMWCDIWVGCMGWFLMYNMYVTALQSTRLRWYILYTTVPLPLIWPIKPKFSGRIFFLPKLSKC